MIEFQREWLDEQGKIRPLLEDKQQLAQSLANAERALEAARKAGVPVVHVGLRFSAGHPELGTAEHGLRAVIARYETFAAAGKGSEFMPPFTPQDGEFVAAGRTGASAFAGSNLDSYLRNNRIDRLFLMGYALHVCVESTLRTAQRAHVMQHVLPHFGSGITTEEFVRGVARG